MKNYRVHRTHWLISAQLPEEPEEEEPEKVDAVLDIGDNDVVFVAGEEVATAGDAVGIVDDIGIGGEGINPKAKFLEVLSAINIVDLADKSGLLGARFPAEGAPDAVVEEFKETFRQGRVELEELVPDCVLNTVQGFYDWLSTLKVTPSIERLASSSAVWKSTSASGAPIILHEVTSRVQRPTPPRHRAGVASMAWGS